MTDWRLSPVLTPIRAGGTIFGVSFLRLGRRVALALVLVVTLATTAGQAAPERIAACPAPKPLPASIKRPPKGASATQLANFLLALPQRTPCDVNLFTSRFQPSDSPGVYPEGPPMQPLPSATPTEAQVRSQLVSFLGGSADMAAALALFDRADIKAKLPDPTLRAALVALRGTVAEAVIEFFLRSAYGAPPRFGGLPNTIVARANLVGYPQKKIEIVFNRRYQPEHFALLSGSLAHEILHHDEPTNYPEEVVLNALIAITHMQLVARHPDLGTSGTELSRVMNGWALEFMNSRVPGSSRSSLLAPNGKGVAPASPKNVPDFWTLVTKAYTGQIRSGTPDAVTAPPAFAAFLRKLLAPGVALPKPLTFSKKTAELFSRMNDTWLSPIDRLRVSVLLGLVSMDEVVTYTGVTRTKAIAAFRLAPILAAMR
jgi:hypothetical protein